MKNILLIIAISFIQVGCGILSEEFGSGTITISNSETDSINKVYELNEIESEDYANAYRIDCRECLDGDGSLFVVMNYDYELIRVSVWSPSPDNDSYSCDGEECDQVTIDSDNRTIEFNNTVLESLHTGRNIKISGEISYPKIRAPMGPS